MEVKPEHIAIALGVILAIGAVFAYMYFTKPKIEISDYEIY
jgi:predicted negative regulator of RcsB-dependent stress response